MYSRYAVQIRFLLLTLILAVGSLMFTACGGGSSSGGVGDGGGGDTSTGLVTFKVNGEAVSMQGTFTGYRQPSGRISPSLEARGSGRWRRIYIDLSFDWPPARVPHDASSQLQGLGLLDHQNNEYVSVREFRFVIESVSDNRVKGTFSFQVNNFNVTDGRFDVPLEFKDAP